MLFPSFLKKMRHRFFYIILGLWMLWVVNAMFFSTQRTIVIQAEAADGAKNARDINQRNERDNAPPPVVQAKEAPKEKVEDEILEVTKMLEILDSPKIKDPDVEEKLKYVNSSTCLPQYNYLQKTIKAKKQGYRAQKQTKIALIAAYEHHDYIAVTVNSDGWWGKQVFCRYLDQDFNEIGLPVSTEILPEWVVYCCKREGSKFISVTGNLTESVTQWVPMLPKYDTTPKYQMSLCLAPIYGNTSTWLLLSECIEHYLLQGVDHYYVYVQDIDSYSQLLLHDYVRSGQAEVVYLDHHEDRREKEWHLVGVQDCLERSKYESKYVIMADLDERITPNGDVKLVDYTRQKFASTPDIGAIMVRPRWILRTSVPPEKYLGAQTLDQHLPTLIFTNSSAWPTSPTHTAKCIIDPNKVFLMWVHHVSAFTLPNYKTIYMPPHEIVVRHYRDVVLTDWGKRWLPGTLKFGNYSNTYYPKKLQTILYNKVKTRLDRVYSGNYTLMQ